jgi:hypothetical protein
MRFWAHCELVQLQIGAKACANYGRQRLQQAIYAYRNTDLDLQAQYLYNALTIKDDEYANQGFL